MKTKIYLLCLSLLSTSATLLAQKEFEVRVVENLRSDAGLSYNFFAGDDADDFRTTINGFGSGFLLDAFSGRFSKDIFWMGTEDVHLTIGAGLAISKYRFSEPLVFSEENGVYSYGFDTDPAHSYGSGFFSGDKSKLVVGSVIFPVNINFDLGEFYLSGGGTLDIYLSGKHKRKYTVNGERVKEVVRNDRLNDFPINKAKVGLGAMLLHKDSGVSAGVTYMLTPFFEDNTNFPELREVRVSFAYDLSIFDKDRS